MTSGKLLLVFAAVVLASKYTGAVVLVCRSCLLQRAQEFQLLAYADDVNLLGDYIDTINEKTQKP
jgi:hypothetical protein